MRSEKDTVTLLYEIVFYSEQIGDMIERFDRDYEKFIDGRHFHSLCTCAFYVGQIGECANKLTDEFKGTHTEVPWRQIISLRHRIFHDFRSVDKPILWESMVNDIPWLSEYCRRILFELEPRAEDSLRAELSELGID